jgi:hypothetical protein
MRVSPIGFKDVLPSTIRSVRQGGIMASQAALVDPVRRFHRKLLREFLTAGPPRIDVVRSAATASACEAGEALAILGSADLVHVNPVTCEVEVAYPFSAAPTSHLVHAGAYPAAHAMCAIDAVGILLMSGELGSINSVDPISREPLAIVRCGDGWELTPPTIAVLLAAQIGCWGPISAACSFTSFYSRADLADRELMMRSDVCGRVLAWPEALAIAEYEFGSLLAGATD